MAIPNAISTASRYHLSRASYLFVGPGSPANRKFPLNDFQGLDSTGPDVGAPMTPFANLNLSTPTASNTTNVISVTAAPTANVAIALATTLQALQQQFPNITAAGLTGPGYLVTLDVPRNVQVVSSNAGDTTQSVTILGFDQYNQAMTQTIALNGTTPVFGTKAFKYIWQITVTVALAGNLSVGTGPALGLPVSVDGGGFVSGILSPNTADAGTFVAAVRSTATATTGDVYGTYTPAGALNGANLYFVRAFPAMGPNGKSSATFGVPQF